MPSQPTAFDSALVVAGLFGGILACIRVCRSRRRSAQRLQRSLELLDELRHRHVVGVPTVKLGFIQLDSFRVNSIQLYLGDLSNKVFYRCASIYNDRSKDEAHVTTREDETIAGHFILTTFVAY